VRRDAPAAVLLAAALAVAGCGTSSEVENTGAGAPPPATAEATGTADRLIKLTVTPKAGARDVRPDAAVTVTANGGQLGDVDVRDSEGRVITGSYDAERATWRSADPLRVGARYEVRAMARDTGGGAPVLETSRFTTASVPVSDKLEITDVQPADGSTVGVAHPVVVGFDRPVADKATVQKALNVVTDPPVRGAWYWIDDQYAHFRPAEFWPAGTKVTLRTKLAGVKVGDGILGGSDRTVRFEVARRQVLLIDVKKHRMQVVRDGTVIRRFQVSTGKPGWETRNGIKVVMGKDRGKVWRNEEIDAEEEYEYYSDYAMRMTNSGEFIHDAPWNVGNIGEENASHGCVGLKPAAMKWLFENTVVGDAVIVRGSPKPYKDLINRYADWNIAWERWRAGNA
jgi:lipoprotein-anchoring transpeptidase ErfK/SrfK